MADDQDGGLSAGEAASGGAGASDSASGGDAGGTIDWKARAEKAEQLLAKATGKAGSTQADLTAQLGHARSEHDREKSRAEQLERELKQRDVLDAVREKAPPSMRKAVTLAAKGLLPSIDISDPEAAAQAVIEKINSDAPELFKASAAVSTSPHVATGNAPSGGVLVIGGKTIF